jgi:hypothetical protein
MRSPLSFLLISAGLLFVLPTVGEAQQRKPLVIEQVQIGFGPSQPLAKFKDGFWTPVYVELRAWLDREIPAGGKLVVESVDSDDVRSRYTVDLPRMDPDEKITVLTYTRAANSKTEIIVTAVLADRVVATKQEDYLALDLGQHLYLTLGSRQGDVMLRALNPIQNRTGPAARRVVEEEQLYDKDGGKNVTSLEDIRMMPNRWFGFDPVDVIILTTGNRDGFLTALLNEQEGRKEALAEWVRRGGRLVVAVGANQDVVSKLNVISGMLPVAINGNRQMSQLRSVELYAGATAGSFQPARSRVNPNAPAPPIEIAKLEAKPGREFRREVEERDGTPIIVRGPYGLGSVTVVAFDLDKPPFKGWSGEGAFWDKLLKDNAPAFQPFSLDARSRYTQNAENPDLATQLETNLEEFEDVPVISFGWVALFILLYILVVGPLDYFFLKKVVKRLELTWITFPTVVITISVAAYFTAYWLKGNDQKINKVDLIDIDLQTEQVCGYSWFTIFSPRIQHYTVGLEPVEPGWAPQPGPGRPGGSTLVTWMGRPEIGPYGSNRGQSQGLFRRAYDYTPDATAMVGVPIQVWSTKSFAASWQANLDPGAPPVSANLRRLANQNDKLSGTITSHLPVKLDDVAIYYRPYDKWYSLEGGLLPNNRQLLDTLESQPKFEVSAWPATVPATYLGQAGAKSRRQGSGNTSQPTISIVKRLLFFTPAQGGMRDAALHRLDQSWRLPYKDEIIIFGRIAREEGLAEEITQDKATPSRLWLGSLPGGRATRPTLSGTLSQESFVRIIVPVKSTD